MTIYKLSFLLSYIFFLYIEGGAGNMVVVANPSPPPLPPAALPRPNSSPFRPSIAVIVGVLTIMFSITFLLLLYAKHCKRGNGVVYTGTSPLSSAARKNSGIDRTVIESLPVFRFASLRGQKDGLECAVCLTRFEPTEILRLLPKCKHAFHVECVDTWLDAHSTCPLCRYRIDPEDILLVEEPKISTAPPLEQASLEAEKPETETRNSEFRRLSGRHSSAGERGSSGFLQIILHKSDETKLLRRSLDSSSSGKRNETVALGCFDRPRKDQLLLTREDSEPRAATGPQDHSLCWRIERVPAAVERLTTVRSIVSTVRNDNKRQPSIVVGIGIQAVSFIEEPTASSESAAAATLEQERRRTM